MMAFPVQFRIFSQFRIFWGGWFKRLLRQTLAVPNTTPSFRIQSVLSTMSSYLFSVEINYTPFSAGLLASPHSAPGNLDNSKNSESRINRGSRENSTVDFSKVTPAAPSETTHASRVLHHHHLKCRNTHICMRSQIGQHNGREWAGTYLDNQLIVNLFTFF